MNLISYPFRVAESGRVVVVPDGSVTAVNEQLAVLVLTVAGERSLVPGFGLPDAAFGELSVEALGAAIDLFGPPVTITEVLVEPGPRDTQRVVLSWAPREEGMGSNAVA